MADEPIPPGLTEEDKGRVGRLDSESLSANTIKLYEGQWRKVRGWMREKGYPDGPPMDPEHVRDCLTHFAEEKEQAKSTIQAMVNAIRSFHASADLESPTDSTLVKDRKKKLARDKRDEKEEQANPLLPVYLRAIIETAFLRRPYGRGFETEKTARKRGLEDIALLWVCFDALLRISEALGLEWRDIQQLPDGRTILTIGHSKTDQEGKGAHQYISPGAMEALNAHRPEDAKLTDKVFLMLSRATLESIKKEGKDIDSDSVLHSRYKSALRRIKRAGVAAGLPHEITSHSPRVGMAQTLAMAGFTAAEIAQVGRWESIATVLRYISGIAPGSGAVAELYRLNDYELVPGPKWHLCLADFDSMAEVERPDPGYMFLNRRSKPEPAIRRAGSYDHLELLPGYGCGGSGLNERLAAFHRELDLGRWSAQCLLHPVESGDPFAAD